MIIPKGYVRVRQLVDGGARVVFVSGNAGTGKTTLIQYLRENVARHSVVLAPTGVAALNAGGATVHSFFRFPPRIQDPGAIHIPEDRRLYQRLELLVIDEELRHAIHDRINELELWVKARQRGSRSFREEAVKQLLEGTTTVEEVLAAS